MKILFNCQESGLTAVSCNELCFCSLRLTTIGTCLLNASIDDDLRLMTVCTFKWSLLYNSSKFALDNVVVVVWLSVVGRLPLSACLLIYIQVCWSTGISKCGAIQVIYPNRRPS